MCRGALRGKALPRPMLPALGGAAALGLGGGGPLPLCSHAQGQDLNGILSIMLTKGCPLITQMFYGSQGGGGMECSHMLESSGALELSWSFVSTCR